MPFPTALQSALVLADEAPPRIDRPALQAHIRQLLVLLGQDPDEPGLLETPRRVTDWWVEFLEHDPGRLGTTFDAIATDQLVVVRGMRVWSLCEHHLLPFWCDIAVGYLAAGKVLGLSKFGRLARKHAHRLQLQERLVHGLAEEITAVVGSPDVAVLAEGEHLCMASRGVEMPHRMVSSATFGRFRENSDLRAEFMAIAKGG